MGYTTPEARRAWYLRNKEHIGTQRRAWVAANKERVKGYQRAYRRRNPNRHAVWWRNLKARIFLLYGKRCVRCGFGDERALQLDHVQNDGYKFRKTRAGRRTTKPETCWLKASKEYQPKVFQILCANCNWIKRHEHNARSPKESRI